MGLWNRIRGYFVTDIEVVLDQVPDQAWEAAKRGQDDGAVLVANAGGQLRVVFLGRLLGAASGGITLTDGHDGEIALERRGRDLLTVAKTAHASWLCRGSCPAIPDRFQLGIDTLIGLTDPHGRPMAIKRYRHRDFVPFT